jgi:mannitol/fructose-specific phosphotransferase system IIA component (Ntr-type)
MSRDTKYFFVVFTIWFQEPCYFLNFSADDEPVFIVLHVPSAREKQDYQQQSTRIMHFIILQ